MSGSLRKTLPTYALFLVSEIVWMAIVPVAPSFADKLDLSKVEVGAVLASAGLATLIVSLPIGLVSDRIGTRGLLRWSAAVVAVSTLGQGLATDFWSLLAARALFGAALGTIWTAGLAWIAEDVLRYQFPAATCDLVIMLYLQLPSAEREQVIRAAAAALAPSGTFLLVAHDSRNLEHGYGGPPDPTVLYTAEDVVADLRGLEIERAGIVERPVETPEGDEAIALDALVRARRI